MNARLVEVQGDQEEFADLIGRRGSLGLDDSPNCTFLPNGCGDILVMVRPLITYPNGKVSLETKVGNTFIFVGDNDA